MPSARDGITPLHASLAAMKTILVVDDFASVRFYHQSLLRAAGFETASASDGQEALDYLERQAVDLVVLDLMMPRMNGAEFLGEIRRNPRFAKLPVLIITSEKHRDTARDLVAQGNCALLHKPILPDSFLRGVRQLVG